MEEKRNSLRGSGSTSGTITDELQDAGVKSFADAESFAALLAGVEEKRGKRLVEA